MLLHLDDEIHEGEIGPYLADRRGKDVCEGETVCGWGCLWQFSLRGGVHSVCMCVCMNSSILWFREILWY